MESLGWRSDFICIPAQLCAILNGNLRATAACRPGTDLVEERNKADVQRDLRNLTPMPIELVGERGFEPPTSRSQFTGSAKN